MCKLARYCFIKSSIFLWNLPIFEWHFSGNKSCYKGRTDRDCCTSSNKCGIGGGDCDSDSDCESGLVCGTNNCRSFNNEASSSADCCMEKRKT